MSFLGRGSQFQNQLAPTFEQRLNKLSVKPVYDIAAGAKLQWWPFELVKASQTFTYSDATILSKTATLDSVVAYQIADEMPTALQKQNTIGGYSFGDNTDLETILFLKPNSAFEITQCFIQAAFALNISAFTDNGVTFDDIEYQVRLYNGGATSKYKVIAGGTEATGHNQLVAAEADIFILQAQFSGESIQPTDTIGLYFKCNNTQVATNTFQSLLLPWFSFTETDYTKSWYQSGMMSHVLPSFDNAAPAFKHELQNWPIDDFGSPRIL